VHSWADLQLVHGFRCYDNIVPNAKCQRMLVLAVCLVIIVIIIFWAHQHKAAGLKIKLSKIKMVTTASHSVTIVLWKETTFPL